MRAVVVGAGAVGTRAARQLLFMGDVDSLAIVEPISGRREAVVESLGDPARQATDAGDAVDGADVVILAGPRGHRVAASAALSRGASVVSVSDDVDDVRDLLALDAEAIERGLHVVVGAGFSPGLSCLLAALAGRSFEQVEEIHVAKMGAGGPACARQHHLALQGPAVESVDGVWQPPARRLRPGPHLVSRPRRGRRLLSGRPGRTTAPCPGLPRRRAGERPRGRQPS